MNPVGFPQINHVFTKPEGWTDEQCAAPAPRPPDRERQLAAEAALREYAKARPDLISVYEVGAPAPRPEETPDKDGGRCAMFCLERGIHVSRALEGDGCECRVEFASGRQRKGGRT